MRFEIAYHLGKDLSFTEVDERMDNLKEYPIHIIDNEKRLPDLFVMDMDAGREYVSFLNKPYLESDIDGIIKDIEKNLNRINGLNRNLIKPQEVLMGKDEDDNPIYDVPLKEGLYYQGYLMEIERYSKNIERKLDELKEIHLKG